MVEINTTYPFFHRKRRAIEVSHKGGKREDKGSVNLQRRWTDRLPHPTNMSNYDKWANDAEANIAFNVLTDIIAGVGFYTEMPDDIDENHKNKKTIDESCKTVNLDEDLQEITMAMLQKGFCPVERIIDGKELRLKILPPESFYVWMTKKGVVYRYTQERTIGDIVSVWQDSSWKKHLNECKEHYEPKEFKELTTAPSDKTPGNLEDIILFFHRKTTSWPYGKSLVESIGTLLDERDQMNEDMPKAIHKWAYPGMVWKTRGPKADLETAVTDREVDEHIFIGNVEPEEVTFEEIKIDPQARFIPYIELIYYQICEGLHAPLLLYLKNATEASATVMMESVDRLTGGIQRYIKRRVEKFLFEPQVGEPVPRLVWGQPKTGLEDKTLADVVALYPHLAPNQGLDLLKQFGIELPDPEWPKQPQLPMQPFQKPQIMPPMEAILEKLNDLDTALNVIETNFREKRIDLVKSMEMGQRAINVHVRRMFPKQETAFTEKRNQEYEKWAHRLIGVKKEGQVYSVHVSD